MEIEPETKKREGRGQETCQMYFFLTEVIPPEPAIKHKGCTAAD
jgi:hypothetical protein